MARVRAFSGLRAHPLLPVLAVALLLHLYWLARYSGNWIEWDSSLTTATIQAVMEEGTIEPKVGRVYWNGLGYPALSSVVASISGLSAQQLQRMVFPLLSTLGLVVAYVLYFQFTQRVGVAALATLFLALQSDFLFVSSRGTHEKFTFVLIMASLFLLMRLHGRRMTLVQVASYGTAFYLVTLALSTMNVFFSSLYLGILILVLVAGYLLVERWLRFPVEEGERFRSLIYPVAIFALFLNLIIFYVYPPGIRILLAARSLLTRLGILIFYPEQGAEPLGAVINDWISPYVWLGMRTWDWTLLGFSGFVWLSMARAILRKDLAIPWRMSMLWLFIFYAAFGIHLVVAVAFDRTGTWGIDNAQVRIFPLVMLFAAPLAALGVTDGLARIRRLPDGSVRLLLQAGLLALLAFGSLTAVLKATSEPTFSNLWHFYTPAESYGVKWLNDRVRPLGPHAKIWADFDFRIGEMWLFNYWGSSRQPVPIVSGETQDYRYIFLSETIALRSLRLRDPLPDVRGASRIYDNGEVQVYLRDGPPQP